MFLIIGFNHRTVQDYGSIGEKKCTRCNNDVEIHRLKVTTWITLFFIPIFPYKKSFIEICPICKDTHGLSKEGSAEEQTDHQRYHGKTETQIAYLKQMEELNKNQD